MSLPVRRDSHPVVLGGTRRTLAQIASLQGSRVGRIIELPESVRVRIAAGEVIERPASVVRELLDNSIDAGATAVVVELAGGGVELVRVVDNGCGMDREDLALSVRRGATSKLRTAEDLSCIATLGFRGEAIPSIGSVSRMRITSRTSGSDEAWQMIVEGGAESGPRPTSAAEGTAVEVRDLFFNVPVRRRFLRSASTESSRAADAVMQAALARPRIAVRLVVDGRETTSVGPAERPLDRIAAIEGPEVASSLLEVHGGEEGQLALSGLVGDPGLSRSGRGHVHVFVNHRPVEEPVVVAALREAYGGALPSRRFPVAFLYLDVAPEEVDVNVHPAKREIRLRSPQSVFRLVSWAVKEALGRATPSAASSVSVRGAGAAPREAARVEVPRGDARREAGTEEVKTFDLWTGERTAAQAGVAPRAPSSAPAAASAPETCSIRFVGQTAVGYIIAEAEDEILILDPHALHERVIFERLMARSGAAESQRLLVPVTLELRAQDAGALREVAREAASLGFEMEPFGGGSFLVRAVPPELRDGSVEECIRDMLDRASEPGGASAAALRERMMAAVACKGAVKLGERLSPEQAQALIDEAAASGAAHICPHGRPTTLSVKGSDIERRFKR